MGNVQAVQAMYEAFGRGDIATIVAGLDDAVEWETKVPAPGVPWLQPRRGKAQVPGFFAALAPLEFERFEPFAFFDGGDQVFVLVHVTVKHLGQRYDFPLEGHYWRFGPDGKVIAFDHVVDTALMVRMARGE